MAKIKLSNMDKARPLLCSESDSRHDGPPHQDQAQATRKESLIDWHRSTSSSYSKQIVHSLIKIGRVPSRKDILSPSTTSAQLRAATVRGEISASEEQVEIARAQRERNAIHYHAGESVRAGNDAAAVKRDDIGYWIDYGSGHFIASNTPPPLVGSSSSSISSRTVQSVSMQQQQLAVLDNVSGDKNGSNHVSKSRMPWKRMKNPDTDKNSIVEENVLQMKHTVLQESHNQAGALLNSSTAMQQPDSKARTRVKLIIEHPDIVDGYIRMGLKNDPDMDSSQMIRMIDYYCT